MRSKPFCIRRSGMLRTRILAVLASVIVTLAGVLPFTVEVRAEGDTTIPALTAVVNDGLLTVTGEDETSGIAAIYVNGFEFTDIVDGSVTIRMQQFDTGYQYFTMQVKDGAGNMSEVYRVNNPYYSFPDEDNGVEDKEQKLPKDAKATKPSDSEAEVTDHIKTDKEGNRREDRRRRRRSSSSDEETSSSAKKRNTDAVTEDDEDERSDDYEIDSASVRTEDGREFYTITTKSGKVFYLVIERSEDGETVHFLTDITENDLLNVTSDNKPTLPQNSAVVVKEAGLQEVSAGSGRFGSEDKKDPGEPGEPGKESLSLNDLLMDDAELQEGSEDKEPGKTSEEIPEETPIRGLIKKYGSLMAVAAIGLIVVIGYIIMKFLKRGDDEGFIEDEEGEECEDAEDSEEMEDETDKRFFDDGEEESGFFDQYDQEAGDTNETAEEKEPEAASPRQTEPDQPEKRDQPEQEAQDPQGDKQTDMESLITSENDSEGPIYSPYPSMNTTVNSKVNDTDQEDEEEEDICD